MVAAGVLPGDRDQAIAALRVFLSHYYDETTSDRYARQVEEKAYQKSLNREEWEKFIQQKRAAIKHNLAHQQRATPPQPGMAVAPHLPAPPLMQSPPLQQAPMQHALPMQQPHMQYQQMQQPQMQHPPQMPMQAPMQGVPHPQGGPPMMSTMPMSQPNMAMPYAGQQTWAPPGIGSGQVSPYLLQNPQLMGQSGPPSWAAPMMQQRPPSHPQQHAPMQHFAPQHAQPQLQQQQQHFQPQLHRSPQQLHAPIQMQMLSQPQAQPQPQPIATKPPPVPVPDAERRRALEDFRRLQEAARKSILPHAKALAHIIKTHPNQVPSQTGTKVLNAIRVIELEDLSTIAITPAKVAQFSQMLTQVQAIVKDFRNKYARKKAAAGAPITESIASTAIEGGSQTSEEPPPITSNGLSQPVNQPVSEPLAAPAAGPSPAIPHSQAEDPTKKLLRLLQPQHRQRPPSLPPAVVFHIEELREKEKKCVFPLPNLSYTRVN